MTNFDYGSLIINVTNAFDAYIECDTATPAELAAVQALYDHLATYPGIVHRAADKPADDIDQLARAFLVADARFRIGAATLAESARAARALVAAHDAAHPAGDEGGA